MSKKNEKKIKRFRKGRVWPSAVFLIYSLYLSAIAFVAFVTVILIYFAKDRLSTTCNDVLRMGRMFVAEQSSADDDLIMRYLQQDSDYYEAIYLLDDKQGVLSGFGDRTYDLEHSISIPMEEEVEIHPDFNAKYNLFFGESIANAGVLLLGELPLDDFPKDFLSLEGWKKRNIFTFHEKKEVFEDTYWISVAVSEQKTLMVKSRIYFYDGDFMLAITIGVFSVLAMIIPMVFLFINILNSVSQQRKMRKLIYTDQVTSGRNWLYFEHYADKLLKAGRNASKSFAIADITLMKYRGFCTLHGPEAGEELLEVINRELSFGLKRTECCAHYGKASFALLLKCTNEKECGERIHEILERVPGRLGYSGQVFHAGIFYIEPARRKNIDEKRERLSVAECYNRACAARAALADENQSDIAFFDQKLLEEQIWEHKVGERMQKALENEEFQVYLQPKYNPVTEKLAGAEALVRWISPEDGFISPGRFIPIFEKNGFIIKLDDYMISHVAKLQAEWLAEGKEVVPVSVNVSRAHFANPDLAKHISELVDVYHLPHHLVEIELTESAFFDDKSALLNTVRELKTLGFDISMDDFGAGYSSLNSLKDLPLDVLKLDAEFFRGEDEGKRGEIVVSQAIHLAKELNMRIVAEGVEKKDQVDFLASQDCDMIQGFYFAKPMPADEYKQRLAHKNEKPLGLETTESWSESVKGVSEAEPEAEGSVGVSEAEPEAEGSVGVSDAEAESPEGMSDAEPDAAGSEDRNG